MLFENIQQFIVLGTAGLAFLGQFTALIWRISKAEENINTRISTVEHENHLSIVALRQELLKIQLEASNLYLKRESFKSFMETVDSRLIRLEDKLDEVIKRY